jgi:serine/threonine protein kinase
MDSTRWKRVEDVYHAAIGFPVKERAAFLDTACSGDEALRREVESLLAQKGEGSTFFAVPAVEVAAGSSSASPGSSIVGRQFGPYRVTDLLGAGGMGEVYRARDTKLNRDVALKVLPEAFTRDADRLARFTREAQVLASLNHPNIAAIHGLEESLSAEAGDAPMHAIVLELVEGETLADRIARGAIPLDEALPIAGQIAEALEAAHSTGIVHRDIKPSNIKINPAGRVKLLDFGIAKVLEAGHRSFHDSPTVTNRATRPDVILGTAAYMSPEQARGHLVDTRTDVWAFGCVLFEMLSAAPAFARDNVSDTIAAILEREPDWDRLPRATPEVIRRLLRQCLQKDANRRLQDIAATRQEIENALGRNRSKPSPLTIGVLVLVILAVVVWFIRGREAPDTLQPVPLTTFLGSQDWPSFSPDGDQVAFSWDGDRQDDFNIYVQRIGSGPPLRLTDNSAIDTHPAWSPDGSTIAFFRVSKPGRLAIVLIPPLGGPERVVTEIQTAVVDRASLAWSPDSKWLVVFDEPAQQPRGLWLLSVETGERRQLTSVPAGVADEAAVIAPDGRTLGFARLVAPNSADLYVLPLDEDLRPRGEPRRLTYDNEVFWGLAWTGDARELVFSSGSPGNLKLSRMATAKDSRPTRLVDQSDVFNIAIAPRSNRLVFVRSRREMDIYRVELSSSGTEARGAMPLIASSRLDRFPSYSPDGKRMPSPPCVPATGNYGPATAMVATRYR